MNGKICVIGLGYIGLPTAVMFASAGFEVIGVDTNPNVISSINSGYPHVVEPGLTEALPHLVAEGRLRASLKPEEADAFIIAVPTPVTADLKADLSYVREASQSIVSSLKLHSLVIVESTVPPGTTDDIVRPILEQTGFTVGRQVFLAHCPERVLPGKILRELVYNNRIIGGVDDISTQRAASLYRSFVQGDLLLTQTKVAEMAKLMENIFRDVNIALANELVQICDSLAIDALEVIKLANCHPRVNLHQPGPGVGGHCLAVDPYFVVERAPEQAKLISLARQTNREMPQYIADRVLKLTAGIDKAKIAVLGITYKGNVTDMRESPAIDVIEILEQKGFNVKVYDPYVDHSAFELVNRREALSGAHCALVLADHSEFKNLDPQLLKSLMSVPMVFDTKNCVDLKDPQIISVNLGTTTDVISRINATLREAAVGDEAS